MSQWLFLLRELVRRDLQARYAGSFLGFAWSFVQPLVQLLLFTFVFSSVMKVTPVGERTASFAVFLFCGLLPWTAFHETVLRATTAITDNATLIKKLSFPSEVLVLAVALSALVHQAVATLAFAAILGWRGELSLAGLPWLALAVPLQVALAVGLGLFVAALHVFVRDVGQVLGLLLTAWFYFTPIVYPLALVPGGFRAWVEANPLTALVALYRAAFLGNAVGAGPVYLAVVSAVLLFAGLAVFRRLRPAFVDAI